MKTNKPQDFGRSLGERLQVDLIDALAQPAKTMASDINTEDLARSRAAVDKAEAALRRFSDGRAYEHGGRRR
jgi:hypothetical protein